MTTIRDVSTLIGYVDHGRAARTVNAEFGELMDKLSGLAAESPKAKIKGVLTVQIGLELFNGSVAVTVQSKTKSPADPGHSGLYFLDREGRISTEHPTQLDMLRAVHGADEDGVLPDDPARDAG